MSSLKLEPATGSFQVGDSFSIKIFLDGADQVNAAQVNLSFSAALLQAVSVDFTGSTMPLQAENVIGQSTLTMARSVQPGDPPASVSGKSLFGQINFKALANGMAEVHFDDSCEVDRLGDAVNVLNNKSDGLFILGPAGLPELDIVIQKTVDSFNTLKAVII